ncbi:hypothetical protein D3C80_1664430 [compost metagenome]
MIKHFFRILHNSYASLPEQLFPMLVRRKLPYDIAGAAFDQLIYGTNCEYFAPAYDRHPVAQKLNFT